MRKQTVLLPLDGSAFSRQVIPAVCRLLHPEQYQLVLLRVTELPAGVVNAPDPVPTVWPLMEFEYTAAQVPSQVQHPVYNEQLEQNAREEIERSLALEQRVLEEAGYTVTLAVRFGDPAQEIVDSIRNLHVDMIAMATHGRTGVSKLLMGSVAEHVLKNLSKPLLLVRPHTTDVVQAPTSTQLNTILVPLDGSEFAEQALEEAKRLANIAGAELVLLSAAPLVDMVGLAAAGAFASGLPEQNVIEQDRLRAYLKEINERLKAQGYRVSSRLVIGQPEDAIAQLSESEHADLIVMATHGRSGLGRLLLGSVAARVVHEAKLPVLLVHPQPNGVATPAEGDANVHQETVNV